MLLEPLNDTLKRLDSDLIPYQEMSNCMGANRQFDRATMKKKSPWSMLQEVTLPIPLKPKLRDGSIVSHPWARTLGGPELQLGTTSTWANGTNVTGPIGLGTAYAPHSQIPHPIQRGSEFLQRNPFNVCVHKANEKFPNSSCTWKIVEKVFRMKLTSKHLPQL